MIKLKKVQSDLHKLDLAYMHIFQSEDGKAVLEDLIKRFLPDKLTTDSEHGTVVRASESNPIRYIQRRVKDGMDGRSVR